MQARDYGEVVFRADGCFGRDESHNVDKMAFFTLWRREMKIDRLRLRAFGVIVTMLLVASCATNSRISEGDMFKPSATGWESAWGAIPPGWSGG